MITKIDDNLFLSGEVEAARLQFANPLGITTVVNVALTPDSGADGIGRVHVPMLDGNIAPESFDTVLKAIADHTQRGRVLVHCVMGTSRSAVVVALYLSITKGISLREALRQLKTLRLQVSPTPETLASAKKYLEQRKRD